VPVAAHDHVGVNGATGLENAIVCRISPDDPDHLARLDHRGDPGHLGHGRFDPIGGPAELLAEDATELGEHLPGKPMLARPAPSAATPSERWTRCGRRTRDARGARRRLRATPG